MQYKHLRRRHLQRIYRRKGQKVNLYSRLEVGNWDREGEGEELKTVDTKIQ